MLYINRERTCRKILEYIFKDSFPITNLFTHPVTGNYIELDGYNKNLKIAFEYNGEQHYKRVKSWQTEDDFKKQQERDIIVEKKCKEAGIKLIVIPYTVKHNNLYKYIIEQMPEYDFPKTIDYCELKLESYGSEILNELKTYVKDNFEGKILSNIYVGCCELLDCECKNGHLFQRSAVNIKKNVGFCIKCQGYDVLHNISEFCKKYDYTLLDQYAEVDVRMNWKCNKCDDIFSVRWYSLRQLHSLHTCNEKVLPTSNNKNILFITNEEDTLAIEDFCILYDYTLLSQFSHKDFDMEWECNKCEDIFIRKWCDLSKLENLHTCQL